jgi:hypothetical protein
MLNAMTYTAAQLKVQRSNNTGNDKEISETVDRVYKKYGNDLSAYYREVKNSINIEKCDEPRPKRGVSD